MEKFLIDQILKIVSDIDLYIDKILDKEKWKKEYCVNE
jgi:hypothetical protein